MKFGIAVFFKTLIQNSEAAPTLGHVMKSAVYTTEIFYLQNRPYYIPFERRFHAD